MSEPRRYAFLGPEGTFTEQALRSLPESEGAELVPCPTVTVALDEVRTGVAYGAVVPIENSVEGSVPVTLDELATGAPLIIRREITVPVAFSLLARPGTALADLSVVATHPHGAAQTRRWVAANLPGVEVLHTSSTAAAAAGLASGEAGLGCGDLRPGGGRALRPGRARRGGRRQRGGDHHGSSWSRRPAPPRPAPAWTRRRWWPSCTRTTPVR